MQVFIFLKDKTWQRWGLNPSSSSKFRALISVVLGHHPPIKENYAAINNSDKAL